MAPRSFQKTTGNWLEPCAIAAVVAVLVISGVLTFQNIQRLRKHTDLVTDSQDLLVKLELIESKLKDAETGQRGYIITGQEEYLTPYLQSAGSIDTAINQLEEKLAGDRVRLDIINDIRVPVTMKLEEMEQTIELRRTQGFEAAQEVIANNIGKRTMDAVLKKIDSIREMEQRIGLQREATADSTYYLALVTGLISTFLGMGLIGSVLYLLNANRKRAELAAREIAKDRDQLQEALERTQTLELENLRLDTSMRKFLEQIRDYAIFAMDDQCRAVTWNEGVKHVLGFTEEEFIGQDVRPLIFPAETRAAGIADAEFATAAAEGSASDDRWMMRKGGINFWASGITSSINDDSGRVTGYSKVMRDLTERKLAEDAMAQLAAELAESDQRKNEFLATLAHELRNPLAPVKSAVQLMEMSELSPEVEELRSTMARQIEQMIRLIDDLLDISRINRGKIKLRVEVIDVRTAIKAAIESANMFIAEKNQSLTVKLGDEPVMVKADPARVIQAVSNLLNNASRYSDAGAEISVQLTVEVQADVSPECAVIQVADQGVGIEPDRMDEIFKLFAQVTDADGRGEAGLGIGLALVKTLVELHQGTVTASSEGIGKGSQFTIYLPISHETAIEKPVQQVADSSIKIQTFKVLVVEDLKALRTIMARLLTKMGHQVQVAEDGLVALEILKTYSPDVIFSDISMPHMTGYDLARELRRRPNTEKTYLVAMTGFGQSSDRVAAADSGFDEHLVKPVDVKQLEEIFRRLCLHGD